MTVICGWKETMQKDRFIASGEGEQRECPAPYHTEGGIPQVAKHKHIPRNSRRAIVFRSGVTDA